MCRRRGIAYKTGTSYGYRDAWSIGFDGRYVLGVWVGRADAGAVPGLSGYVSAAPILFEGFARSGLAAVPLPPRPAGVAAPRRDELPVTLARFGPATGTGQIAGVAEPAPRIVFPPDGARGDLGAASSEDPARAETAGRAGAVPLAGQRQAARRPRPHPHRHLAARRHRLFDADGDRRRRPRRQRERVRGMSSGSNRRVGRISGRQGK